MRLSEFQKTKKEIMDAVSELTFWKDRLVKKIEMAIKNGVLKTHHTRDTSNEGYNKFMS